jgi:hypothetical protein
MTEATAAMPSNPLIHFLAADLEESRQCFDKARAYYERLVSNAPSPLAFIQFQRFVRRCEGIEAARKVFLAARQSSQCSHQVYSAAALLELHLNKEPKVAANVFSLGHKLYGTNIDFVCTYLDFLLHQNDAANFRVVAEKALEQLHVPSTSSTANSTQADQAESARLAAATRVWQRIADFEALRYFFVKICSHSFWFLSCRFAIFSAVVPVPAMLALPRSAWPNVDAMRSKQQVLLWCLVLFVIESWI